VHSIDHFALNVHSLVEAERFFHAFGLDVTTVGAGTQELELRSADGHRWARILSADRKSLAYLSFNCYARDLPALRKQAAAAGAIFVASANGNEAAGFWFHDPDGNLIQVAVGPKTSPGSKTISVNTGAMADVRGACTRAAVQPVKPRRLSHVLLFTPDVLVKVSSAAANLATWVITIVEYNGAPPRVGREVTATAENISLVLRGLQVRSPEDGQHQWFSRLSKARQRVERTAPLAEEVIGQSTGRALRKKPRGRCCWNGVNAFTSQPDVSLHSPQRQRTACSRCFASRSLPLGTIWKH